jgi:hypothetical protein
MTGSLGFYKKSLHSDTFFINPASTKRTNRVAKKYSPAGRQAERQTDRQTDIKADRQTDRRTDIQTDRKRDRKTDVGVISAYGAECTVLQYTGGEGGTLEAP